MKLEREDIIQETPQKEDIDSDNLDLDSDLNEDLSFDSDFSDSVPPMEKHSELLKKLMDFSPFLKQKLNEWVGIYWDESKKEFIKNPYVTPIMNEKGAQWGVTYLNTYARDNNMITHIGSDDYDDLREDIIDAIWMNYGTRMEEFGMTEWGDVIRVCNELEHSSELALMGSGDGKAAKILTDSVHRNENVNINPNQDYQQQRPMIPQKKGVLGMVKGLFRGH